MNTELPQGLSECRDLNAQMLQEQLTQEGWKVYILPGSRIDGRTSFFETVRSVLPLDPPLASDDNWNALSDSLWGGLDTIKADRIAVLWDESNRMHHLARNDFDMAQNVLNEVAFTLSDSGLTDGRPKWLCIVLG